MPVAVNCCVRPLATEGLAGDRTAIETSAAGPTWKSPSTESVGALVGAGVRISSSRLLSKIAVAVVEIFCSKLMTEGPVGASLVTVKLRVKRRGRVERNVAGARSR